MSKMDDLTIVENEKELWREMKYQEKILLNQLKHCLMQINRIQLSDIYTVNADLSDKDRIDKRKTKYKNLIDFLSL